MLYYFIGIAGGSGSGKTTIAEYLNKQLKPKASVFHIDNYQKIGGKLPKLFGMNNWDHPDALDWKGLLRDLKVLKSGKPVFIKAREQRELKNAKKVLFKPTPIVIVEGYLLFVKPQIRALLDFLIYCDASDGIRMARRTKFKHAEYVEKILLPMHHKHIEPTKKFADLILDTRKLSIEECANCVVKKLPKACFSKMRSK